MNKAKTVGIGIGIFVIIVGVFGGLLFYSYSQVHVNLNNVSFHSIDWVDFTFGTILNLGLNVLSGNWLMAAFDLIDGINLNLFFELSNYGLLPVYIPDLSYDLSVNNVRVGTGNVPINLTIYPGETRDVKAFQNFKKNSLSPAILSIVENNGMMNLKVKGTAFFQLFGLSIPVPFESTKQISVYDEIKKKLTSETATQKTPTYITLKVQDYTVYEGDSVYINGRLTLDNGRALQNALVYIKDEDTGSGDDDIRTLTTDSNGNFGFTWTAVSMDPFDSVVEIYAVFEGSSSYDSARSNQYNVSVLPKPIQKSQEIQPSYSPPSTSQPTFKSTSITLNIPYTNVNSGDIVPISGRLIDSSGQGVANALIYIKDEDTGSGDDEMGTLYTDSSGYYSANWRARTMDPFDSVVEIYAVFEGSSNYGHARSIQINVRVN